VVGGVLVTVNELLSLPSGERLDRPEPVPPVVDAETYLTLVTVANALGELVARANAEQRYPAEQEAGAIYEQVRGGGGRDPVRDRGPQSPAPPRARSNPRPQVDKGATMSASDRHRFQPGNGAFRQGTGTCSLGQLRSNQTPDRLPRQQPR
jgi:hypothetical protein